MGGSADKIESLIDGGVAALFAIACAFPAFMIVPEFGRGALVSAAAVFVLAFVSARRVLARFGSPRRGLGHFELAPLPEFPVVEWFGPGANDEPAATDDVAGLRAVEATGDAGVLELDEVLPMIGPTSRVVQLFDPPPQATAGALAVRIDRHLACRDVALQSPPDASNELFDALDQLRRSLR